MTGARNQHRRLAEKAIQELFDEWPEGASISAGVPEWMSCVGREQVVIKKDRTLFPLWASKYSPDAVFRGASETFLIELKRAAKAEPLVLAQVLYGTYLVTIHEASGFSNELPSWAKSRQASPVIVTQCNSWLRGAITALSQGDQLSRIRPDCYLEVDAPQIEGRLYYWFDAPLMRRLRRLGGHPLSGHKTRRNLPRPVREWTWYRIDGLENFIGFPSDSHREERPLFPDGDYAMSAPVGARGEHIFWEMSAQSKGGEFSIVSL